jgi:hypothetical protein
LWEGGSSEPLFFLCKEYGTAQMALKRLPVLFFVAESYSQRPAAAQKRAAGGEWDGKSAHKSLLHFEICI